ncbi:UPF0481 protein At3g47200-like [Eucalyptus grandis]|uniref:UPF0481 protein At3g47200-like n=1 Tax=Eucalyptus grandis TaxID=71139 RepID=UPI00192EDE3D|nr:UPF0481 protein At3g47200-like [Eucalyptus grandis]XP_039157355.1 UPF0481 protein At3g47200-like [Eucalyptus grandis]
MALISNEELNQTVAHEPQQETSKDGQIEVETDEGENLCEDESRPPESDWIISINKNLDKAEEDHMACSWKKRSIYRIPHYLKDGKEKACVPQIVSIGPFHHGDERLCEKDKDKWRGLVCMLKRNNQRIEEYLDAVTKVEEKARACYEATIDMCNEKFIEMMVLDGCFVIELFWGFFYGFDKLGYTHDDPVFSSSRSSMDIIRRDMILLENQIPLFILDLLFCLQLGQPDRIGLLAKLALQFFYSLKPTDCPLYCLSWTRLEFDPLPLEGELHCLELFRRSLLYPRPKPVATQQSSQTGLQFIHCVTELRKKGIKFRNGEVEGFWNIRFKDGILEIPRLVIGDETPPLFLNLIAFEQCHFNCGNDITSYLIFMDNLINSAEDVGHLHDCGIMEHWLGSDTEVADLFNKLCKEVVLVGGHSYLSGLSKDVNTYSGNKCNGYIASLKLKYFSNPWSIISLIAAIILLVLTLAQTLYAVFGYYRPGF